MFIQPTYNLDVSLEWGEHPPSWAGDGARAKYKGIWIWYISKGPNITRLEVAEGGSVPTPLKQALQDGGTKYFSLSTITNWSDENPGYPIKFDIEPDGADISEFLQFIIDTIDKNINPTDQVGPGVQFAGTPDAGRGEVAWMSGLTMAQQNGWFSSFPGCGSNLRHEHVISVGRLDAAELDHLGNIIAIIECQDGIQNGKVLDSDHFEKSISRYPYAPEVQDTLERVIVIAGGYTEAQINSFRTTPWTSILLKTIKTEAGTIGLERVL